MTKIIEDIPVKWPFRLEPSQLESMDGKMINLVHPHDKNEVLGSVTLSILPGSDEVRGRVVFPEDYTEVENPVLSILGTPNEIMQPLSVSFKGKSPIPVEITEDEVEGALDFMGKISPTHFMLKDGEVKEDIKKELLRKVGPTSEKKVELSTSTPIQGAYSNVPKDYTDKINGDIPLIMEPSYKIGQTVIVSVPNGKTWFGPVRAIDCRGEEPTYCVWPDTPSSTKEWILESHIFENVEQMTKEMVEAYQEKVSRMSYMVHTTMQNGLKAHDMGDII